MILFSDLRRFELLGARPAGSASLDLAVALLDVDYPPVTHCVLQAGADPPRALPWAAVEAIDWQGRTIHVDPHALDYAASVASLEATHVLLHRDVLDALILDLQDRCVTRANDLWLEREGTGLRLQAADTRAWAIVRRLSGGRFPALTPESACQWKYVEFLRGAPEVARAGAAYHRRIVHLPAGEIASLTLSLPYLHVAELLTLLPDQLAADTLERMSAERRLQVFEELHETTAVRVLQRMAPDVSADLIGQMETDLARQILEHLPAADSTRIVELLRYPEDTAGGLMTDEVIMVEAGWTVAQARWRLRDQLRRPDFVYFVYVVESQASRKLRGVLSLRDLLVNEDDCVVSAIMNSYLLTLSPLEPAETAARRLLESQLLALPVVGGQGELLGVVTIDAAVAVIAPRRWSSQAPRVFS